jgi:lysozyme family protein
MQVDYPPFIDRVIQHYEGPYGWNRKDAGGPTKYGITCFDLAAHRGEKMDSMERWAPIVQAMPLSEAEAIYRTKYATGIGFDTLPAGCDVVILDYAINSGVGRGKAILAEFKADLNNPSKFIDEVCAERLRFMHAIRGGSDWVEFGHGWQARVDDLQLYAHHLVQGHAPDVAPPVKTTVVPVPKAQHVPTTVPGKTAGGAVATGVALHQMNYSWPIIIGGMVAVAAIGIAYEAWSEHQTNAMNLKVA